MTLKRAFSFVISLFLTGLIALAQQAPQSPPQPPAATPAAPAAPGEPFGNAFSLFVGGGTFLGVYAEDINKANMSRYGLREAKGVGITGIVKDSPAEKAGLKKDDVIARFDNENVTSVRKLNRLVSEVAPDQTIRLSMSRGGVEREVAVTIGKRKDSSDALQKLQGLEGLQELEGIKGMIAPGARVWKWEGQEPGGDGFTFAFGRNRRIGVSTVQLTKQLADYFGVGDGKGVLVTSVVSDSPAAKAGIKAGDVITALDGERIEGAGDLSRALNNKEDGDVSLTIIRDKGQRTITVTPMKGRSPLIQPPGTPQIGRRVIIPRIELPSIPEMTIAIPRIDLPVIPEINVVLPGKPSKARVKTPTPQPI